ncbi:p450 domain containing protein, partial [Asbolus verrucosus]
MKQGSQYILWSSRASELGILRLVNVHLHPDFIWRLTSMSKEMDLISEKINHYVETIIEAKRRSKYQLENSGESTTDNEISKKKIFLDHLIDLIDKDSEWSNKDLIDETRTLIVAGSDSTALSVCYVLMMLGMHQKIQNLVLEEIDSIGSNSRDITTQDLPKMTVVSTEYKSISEIKLKFDIGIKCVGGQKVELEKRFYC